jgi:hypothetical protein
VSSYPARPAGDRPASGELSPDVRARSILLSTHLLSISELSSSALPSSGGLPPEPETAAVLYGFITVGAVPYLVSLDSEDLHPGPILAAAEGVAAQLGELRLTGELGEWVCPSADYGVAEVLEEHRNCMDAAARDLMAVIQARVAPIRISGIWTSDPGSSELTPVDLAGFEAAQADLWTAYRQEAIRHLNDHHHAMLVHLARAEGVIGCTAANVGQLGTSGAVLTAMSHDGLTDVVIPFDPPVATPAEVEQRLGGLAGHSGFVGTDD